MVAIGGGFSYGALGVSHHATEDIAIMRSLPNLAVVAPGDRWEAAEATRALAAWPGAAYLRLDKSAAVPTHAPMEVFQVGRARLLRQGDDLTLAATGGILGEALLAADQLAREGIECRLLSVHTVKPFDRDALVRAAVETGGLSLVEEHTNRRGTGGAVAEVLLDSGAWPRRFLRLGLRSGFSSAVGSQSYLQGSMAWTPRPSRRRRELACRR